MRIRIRGVEYESVTEAAKRLKVSEATIYCNLSRGRPDSIGKKKGPPKGHPSPNRKQVKIGPVTWPSISHAAKDLGIHWKTLSRRMKRGDLNDLIVIAMKIDAERAKERMATDVIWKK